MATLVLSTVGAAVGSVFGPVGAIIGRAVGAAAGYALDQSLFAADRTVETGRLGDLDLQTSREGAPIPRVYGRARVTGEIIWATRYEEKVRSEESGGGGKGGSSETTVRKYSYYANFAIGLCEGPIARINRVWADGRPFNLANADYRLHRGTASQQPDALIEAKEGNGRAPAYRDTAYVVFERLPLAKFGNRIPQFSFEVIRPVGRLEEMVKAVTLIPGATEFGYSPTRVRQVNGPGDSEPVNDHTDRAGTDWRAAIGELVDLCPNLESVALVVAWFGTDLRANHCEIRPGVVSRTVTNTPAPWRVAGQTRATAHLVSTHDGKVAYGGTPSDSTVVAAIRDLKDRGLAVTLYPFIMMDVPAGNGKTDPYGGSEQGAYPWRGLITGSRAPGVAGSPDKTSEAADQVSAFVGTAAPGDFAINGDAVVYDGPDEWSYRRFILHHAELCKAAGGVDAFLIGSEMGGLTTLRSDGDTYPFVNRLRTLAEDVRSILGGSTKLSYAADWTEFAGHRPDDGSGDVFFHLDRLWAHDDIDFIGIDNYMPLADWRDGSAHLDAEDWDSGRSTAYLRANVAGGEGFDWFYASEADRRAQIRTPITDGAYGKPWVHRLKDLKGWWSNQHFHRPGGAESGSPTPWVPESKPIRFTEAGCPAVDKGANQPNVFPDPKSSASATPYFSTGARDDLIQRRYCEAMLAYWDPDHGDHVEGSNPVSALTGGRMVEHGRTHLWTWDARSYPAFPHLGAWGDGDNWNKGHWLNGRLGSAPAADLVARILADYGIAEGSVGELDGILDGYVVDGVVSARQALEPLAALLLFEAFESGGAIRFVRRGGKTALAITDAALGDEDGAPLLSLRRAQETELPNEIAIGFSDALADFRPSEASARRLVTASSRIS
ncbi:MAG: glycoside hydrolase/phage tail family protein, partial [Rhizobiales bacterium]|nr:glycoside hydrolase/phage tail family protein [Hyphomicrobiales bacterium]